jgi:hypothetical protein
MNPSSQRSKDTVLLFLFARRNANRPTQTSQNLHGFFRPPDVPYYSTLLKYTQLCEANCEPHNQPKPLCKSDPFASHIILVHRCLLGSHSFTDLFAWTHNYSTPTMFSQAWKQFSKTVVGKRVMSTAEEAVTPGLGPLLAAVGTTFGTYMMADFLSNFIQHPTQLVRIMLLSHRRICLSVQQLWLVLDSLFD